MVVITFHGQKYDVSIIGRYGPPSSRYYVLFPISEKVVPPEPPKTQEWIEAKRRKQEEINRKAKELIPRRISIPLYLGGGEEYWM